MKDNELKSRATILLRALLVIAVVAAFSGYPRPLVHAADSTNAPPTSIGKRAFG